MMRYLILCCLGFLFALNTAAAQNQKIAYIDSDGIIQSMPEYKRARAEMEAYSKQLEKKIKAEEEKLANFYQATMAEAENLTPAQLKQKEAEFQQMQEKFQRLDGQSREDLMAKERELTKPIFDRFQMALNLVGKAQGFAYIFDKKYLIYSEGGIDAEAFVRAALGL